MENLKWDREIERLQELQKEGRLGENDMDIDYDDLPKTGVCDKCYKTVKYEEIAMGNGTCAECINREPNTGKKLKVIMTRE
ncbi:hypothetical protein [Clostridium sp. ZBS18]|uniref:hypothetical protein n=1 Tax=Clostridium sp. ZBS18 TaxID=2949967 RepID=UPI00207A7B34|nr:hypothetical protein [Clostridium sp. ZBS18]